MTERTKARPNARRGGRLARLACVLVLMALAFAGLAAPVAAQSIQVIASGRVLPLEAKKGRLMRLAKPAATVFVADPRIADIQVKSPTLIYVFGKKAGETTLFAVDKDDKILVNMTLSVSHNLSHLNRTLRGLMPGNAVRARTVGSAIVLSGTVATARESEDARKLAAQFVSSDKKVINRLRVSGPNQVNLRVRIVEIARNATRTIGINWDAAFTIGSSIVLGIATGGATTVANVFPPNFPIQTRINGVNNVFVGHSGRRHNVNALIDALQTQGLVKTLAEPSLTAISGETASFLAGGEFPVPVPQDGGVITVTFKKFGVGLSFTPTIIGRGRISLKVRPEVSQLSNAGAIQIQGINVPSLTTRRASTTVELASGQSFAIAGLLQNNYTKDISKVPGIGDVPILGKLFTSESYRRDETELVIIVTPYVVKPFDSRRSRLARAARARGSEKDISRLFLGRRGKAKGGKAKGGGAAGAKPAGPPRRLSGPAGFELE